ncbi:MAG TPA: alpha/beta hydrolase family protein [Rhizomicrobium sp.]|nr:alpha/beta hydrolase family protein [Rhizomicrobium sp.]
MRLPLKNDFLAAQWLRTAGHAAAGGADLAECFLAAERVRETDPESWRSAWFGVADRVAGEAAKSAAIGCDVSAHGSWLRAANYYRAAGLFLLQRNEASRLRQVLRRQREAFASAMAARPGWAEAFEIPYQGRTLHGLFFRADGPGPRPTLIMTGGYDSTAEEAYFFSGAAALARGYHFVSYDGPGQGRALEEGLVFRPDWEVVMSAVVAAVEARPEVQSNRIVSMGLSFGGYLAPRAATGCPTLAALLADPGQLSLLDEARTRLPGPLARALPDGNRLWLGALERILEWRRKDLIKGWALRRGMFVHGVETPIAYLKILAEYTSEGRLGRIRCPVFVASAEADEIGATAKRLFNEIETRKSFQPFRVEEAAGEHCESGARSLFNQRAFDWLAETFAAARERGA